jgi:hypothetical protein
MKKRVRSAKAIRRIRSYHRGQNKKFWVSAGRDNLDYHFKESQKSKRFP